jgi:hypothetical protein
MMSAFVSIRELFSLLLPQVEHRGAIAMINAYFDDSGTHADSGVVVMAGIVGTESEIQSLDDMWAPHLASPLDGMKPPIRRFHMYDCYHSLGEFAGWSRTETDYFCHQLREVIIKSHVSAYGFACVRKEWEALMVGEYRVILGDPEGYAMRACFHSAINWAHNCTFDPHMSFVFDDRPERRIENQAVFNLYQRIPRPPQLVGISFLSSYNVRPLQAADLVAWEFYTHAERILTHGKRHPARKEALHLLKNMNMYGQIATKEKIKEMKSSVLRKEQTDPIAREIFGQVRSMISSSSKRPSERRRQTPAPRPPRRAPERPK